MFSMFKDHGTFKECIRYLPKGIGNMENSILAGLHRQICHKTEMFDHV